MSRSKRCHFQGDTLMRPLSSSTEDTLGEEGWADARYGGCSLRLLLKVLILFDAGLSNGLLLPFSLALNLVSLFAMITIAGSVDHGDIWLSVMFAVVFVGTWLSLMMSAFLTLSLVSRTQTHAEVRFQLHV